MMQGAYSWCRRALAHSLALLGLLLFSSSAFSQYDWFPYNGVMPTGWATPGYANAGFIVANDAAKQGAYSLKNSFIDHGQTAAVQVTINVQTAGIVRFDYQVSTECGWDFLRFLIDGVLQGQWSCISGWANVTFPISAGTHTLTWEYFKDAICCVGGSDTVWIDNVILPGQPVIAAGSFHARHSRRAERLPGGAAIPPTTRAPRRRA